MFEELSRVDRAVLAAEGVILALLEVPQEADMSMRLFDFFALGVETTLSNEEFIEFRTRVNERARELTQALVQSMSQ
jgi:hypothetical protein